MRPQNAIYGSMDRGKHATMMLGKKEKKNQAYALTIITVKCKRVHNNDLP